MLHNVKMSMINHLQLVLKTEKYDKNGISAVVYPFIEGNISNFNCFIFFSTFLILKLMIKNVLILIFGYFVSKFYYIFSFVIFFLASESYFSQKTLHFAFFSCQKMKSWLLSYFLYMKYFVLKVKIIITVFLKMILFICYFATLIKKMQCELFQKYQWYLAIVIAK